MWYYFHVKYISRSVEETQNIALDLAKRLTDEGNGPLVFALTGELGAGKTAFVQGFAKGLGIEESIKSPTFILMHPYDLNISKYKIMYHIDAYRINSHKELIPLGIKEILNDKKNIVLIEWAERVEKILPDDVIKIHIKHIDENTREITINGNK